MVGLDEQGCRVGKGAIAGEPACVGVAMRADDGQILYMGIDGSGNFECADFGRKETVFMEKHGSNFTP